MTAPDALRPGEATPAGGARTCHECGHTAIPTRLCVCGHPEEMHDLPKRKAGYVRTRCDWTDADAGKPRPCGCLAYTPEEET